MSKAGDTQQFSDGEETEWGQTLNECFYQLSEVCVCVWLNEWGWFFEMLYYLSSPLLFFTLYFSGEQWSYIMLHSLLRHRHKEKLHACMYVHTDTAVRATSAVGCWEVSQLLFAAHSQPEWPQASQCSWLWGCKWSASTTFSVFAARGHLHRASNKISFIFHVFRCLWDFCGSDTEGEQLRFYTALFTLVHG